MSSWFWRAANSLDREYRQFALAIRHYVSLSPEDAKREYRQRLYRYMRYCQEYSSFWKERWPKECGEFKAEEAEDVLAQLPCLTKQDLRANTEGLRIKPELRHGGDGYPAIRHQRTITTGGSTGIPTKIYIDDGYVSRSRATYDFFYRLAGMDPGTAFFFIWGSPNELRDMKSNWRKKLSSHLRGIFPLPAFGLSEGRINEIYQAVEPNNSIGSAMCFASAAETLMSYAQSHQRPFRRLERVLTGGGLLHDRLREQLRQFMAAEVYNTYASRDFGIMGHESPAHNGLSIPMWWNYVEVLDASRNRVKPGESGEVHVTAINNYSFALMRMGMGDTAKWHPDAGGNPVPNARLTDIMGRAAEHLRGPNGIVLDPSAVIHVVGVVLSPAWLRKFQLVQFDETHYELLVEAWGGAITANDLQALQSGLQNHLGKILGCSIAIVARQVEQIPPATSGKHFYCRIARPEEKMPVKP